MTTREWWGFSPILIFVAFCFSRGGGVAGGGDVGLFFGGGGRLGLLRGEALRRLPLLPLEHLRHQLPRRLHLGQSALVHAEVGVDLGLRHRGGGDELLERLRVGGAHELETPEQAHREPLGVVRLRLLSHCGKGGLLEELLEAPRRLRRRHERLSVRAVLRHVLSHRLEERAHHLVLASLSWVTLQNLVQYAHEAQGCHLVVLVVRMEFVEVMLHQKLPNHRRPHPRQRVRVGLHERSLRVGHGGRLRDNRHRGPRGCRSRSPSGVN
mmetsp:Transcript_5029/g.17446  ORF Transcript_5029/g.17446 Transcript_5029/m.17446 type:complete len:267 (+) Transcript_5029:152-952(+)